MKKNIIAIGILMLVISATLSGCIGNNHSSPSSQNPNLLPIIIDIELQKQWRFVFVRQYTGDMEDIFAVTYGSQLKLSVLKISGASDSYIDVYMGSVLVRRIYSTSELVLDYPGYVVRSLLIINGGIWRVSFYTRMV